MKIERKIIAACLQDKKFANKAIRAKLKPKHFDNQYNASVFYSIKELVNLNDEPTPEAVKAHISADERKKESEKQTLVQRVDKYSRMSVDGSELSLNILENQRLEQDLLELLENSSQQLLEGKNPLGLVDKMSRNVERLRPSRSEFESYSYFEDWDSRKKKRKDVEEGVEKSIKLKLNLHPFEQNFPRGIQAREITAFAGTTGAGKSTMLANFIRLAAHPVNGLNVMYIVAENKYLQAASRLDAILLDQDYNVLFEGAKSNPSGDLFFKNARNDGWGDISIKKVKIRGFDANDLRQFIEDYNLYHDSEVDCLFVDSPDHQQPISAMGEWWRNKAQVYVDNKTLIDDFNLIHATTLPMKPSSIKKTKVTAGDAGGPYDIVRKCDNVVMYNVDPTDRKLNRGKVEVTKARDGDINGETYYFYFEDSKRLTPWTDKFGDKVDPDDTSDENFVRVKELVNEEGLEDNNGFKKRA